MARGQYDACIVNLFTTLVMLDWAWWFLCNVLVAYSVFIGWGSSLLDPLDVFFVPCTLGKDLIC